MVVSLVAVLAVMTAALMVDLTVVGKASMLAEKKAV